MLGLRSVMTTLLNFKTSLVHQLLFLKRGAWHYQSVCLNYLPTAVVSISEFCSFVKSAGVNSGFTHPATAVAGCAELGRMTLGCAELSLRSSFMGYIT